MEGQKTMFRSQRILQNDSIYIYILLYPIVLVNENLIPTNTDMTIKN